jgi:DNA-(apurinic or apyrimidinic site) lyase
MAAERQLRRVIDVFRRLGLEAILNLEKKDPQYVAVCNVVKRHGEEVGATLAMLNALISYRLAGRGKSIGNISGVTSPRGKSWMYAKTF